MSEPCRCESCNRKAAFGAIRRAVTFARNLDYCATLPTTRPQTRVDLRGQAYAVRYSIRLAIESSKETR